MLRRARRPGQRDGDEATLELLRRHGPQILRTARHYSASPEDAEDAYQRGLEILLTKPPARREESDLLPWLKTVVKHEAFAIRRQRERAAPTGQEAITEAAGTAPPVDDHAEHYERLQMGAEALQRLKPHEIRCLLLLAEGFTYSQICDRTGFSYTKVNRCLTEGRRAFLNQVKDIESGAECERLAPRLSAFADGEACAEDAGELRTHLKVCLDCRERLREYRRAPARAAAVVPPALVAASGSEGPLRGMLHSAIGAAQDRAAALGERAHTASELAVGQKAAAVAAATAALAGGGAATVHRESPRDADARAPARLELPVRSDQQAPASTGSAPPPAATAPSVPRTPDTGAATPAAAVRLPSPKPQPVQEFSPAPTPPRARAARSAAAGATGTGGGGGGSSGEFGP